MPVFDESDVNYNLGLSSLSLSQNKINERVPNWLLENWNSGFISIFEPLSKLVHVNIKILRESMSRGYDLCILDLSYNLLAGDIILTICNASSLELLNLAYIYITNWQVITVLEVLICQEINLKGRFKMLLESFMHSKGSSVGIVISFNEYARRCDFCRTNQPEQFWSLKSFP